MIRVNNKSTEKYAGTMYEIAKEISVETGIDVDIVANLGRYFFAKNLKSVLKNEDKSLEINIGGLGTFSFFRGKKYLSKLEKLTHDIDATKKSLKEYEDLLASNTLSSDDKFRVETKIYKLSNTYFNKIAKKRKLEKLSILVDDHREKVDKFMKKKYNIEQ